MIFFLLLKIGTMDQAKTFVPRQDLQILNRIFNAEASVTLCFELKFESKQTRHGILWQAFFPITDLKFYGTHVWIFLRLFLASNKSRHVYHKFQFSLQQNMIFIVSNVWCLLSNLSSKTQCDCPLIQSNITIL